MISREFVQKYLEVKDMLKCDEYKVDPAKFAEYNMDLEPKKLDS